VIFGGKVVCFVVVGVVRMELLARWKAGEPFWMLDTSSILLSLLIPNWTLGLGNR
jgi:hypothetical protein